MLDTAIKIAKLGVLIVCLVVGVSVQALLSSANKVVDELPMMVFAEISAFRSDLRYEIGDTRKMIASELRKTRQDAGEHIAGSALMLDARLGSIEKRLDHRLESIQGDLKSEISTVSGQAVKTMAAYEAVPGTIGSRLDPWTDCKGNGNCWQAQISGTMGSARYTLGQVAKVAPDMAKSAERSAQSTEKATQATAEAMRNVRDLAKPLPKYLAWPIKLLGPTLPLWGPFVWK